MASTRHRLRSDGKRSYQVYWREGGTRTGDRASQTFQSAVGAREFKRAVDEAGDRWPEGWIPDVGWAEQAGQTVKAVHPLLDFGLEYVDEKTGLQADTRHRYDQQVQTLSQELIPYAGTPVTIQGLKTSHVARWINWRETQPVGGSPKTIANYHGLLFAIMQKAVKLDLRTDNPCADIDLPDRDDNTDQVEEAIFLTENEFRLILDCIHPDSRDLITITVATGLRWGEVSALQVRDLKLNEPVPRLQVARAWKKNPNGRFHRKELGDFFLGKPKSKKARRRITLAPAAVTILRRITEGKKGTDFVFTAPRGGSLDQGHFYEYRWQRAIAAAVERGLSKTPRFHDLRHTHAAWLISAGVPLPVIQQRLGHKSITTTVDTYGGLLVQAHEVADAAIEAVLTGGSVPIAVPTPKRTDVIPAADDAVTYDFDDDVIDDGTDDDDDEVAA